MPFAAVASPRWWGRVRPPSLDSPFRSLKQPAPAANLAPALRRERNRPGPFTLHVMNMLGDSSVTMTQSDFILGSTPSIRLDGYLPEPPTMYLDFTDNWWGTTDPEVIAGQILDKNDDDTIDGVVVFEPFRASTAPIKQESMSSFKALFGGR